MSDVAEVVRRQGRCVRFQLLLAYVLGTPCSRTGLCSGAWARGGSRPHPSAPLSAHALGFHGRWQHCHGALSPREHAAQGRGRLLYWLVPPAHRGRVRHAAPKRHHSDRQARTTGDHKDSGHRGTERGWATGTGHRQRAVPSGDSATPVQHGGRPAPGHRGCPRVPGRVQWGHGAGPHAGALTGVS